MRPGMGAIRPTTGAWTGHCWYKNLSISIAQDRIADTGLRIAVLCLREVRQQVHGLDTFWGYKNLSISSEQDRIADTGLRIAVLCLR